MLCKKTCGICAYVSTSERMSFKGGGGGGGLGGGGPRSGKL